MTKTTSGTGKNQHLASVALLLLFALFLTVLMPELRSLYGEDYQAYTRDGNRDGVPDAAEDMNLNGIADLYEDSDHDGISNVFEKFRPVAKVFAESAGQCIDGIDNDANGMIDMADPGCTVPGSMMEASGTRSSIPATTTITRETACADGVDNDSDTMVDMADPDCTSTATSSAPMPTGTQTSMQTSTTSTGGDCYDGIDNDSDSMIDMSDSGCGCTPGNERGVCTGTAVSAGTATPAPKGLKPRK
jgi:hypothetical protein